MARVRPFSNFKLPPAPQAITTPSNLPPIVLINRPVVAPKKSRRPFHCQRLTVKTDYTHEDALWMWRCSFCHHIVKKEDDNDNNNNTNNGKGKKGDTTQIRLVCSYEPPDSVDPTADPLLGHYKIASYQACRLCVGHMKTLHAQVPVAGRLHTANVTLLHPAFRAPPLYTLNIADCPAPYEYSRSAINSRTDGLLKDLFDPNNAESRIIPWRPEFVAWMAAHELVMPFVPMHPASFLPMPLQAELSEEVLSNMGQCTQSHAVQKVASLLAIIAKQKLEMADLLAPMAHQLKELASSLVIEKIQTPPPVILTSTTGAFRDQLDRVCVLLCECQETVALLTPHEELHKLIKYWLSIQPGEKFEFVFTSVVFPFVKNMVKPLMFPLKWSFQWKSLYKDALVQFQELPLQLALLKTLSPTAPPDDIHTLQPLYNAEIVAYKKAVADADEFVESTLPPLEFRDDDPIVHLGNAIYSEVQALHNPLHPVFQTLRKQQFKRAFAKRAFNRDLPAEVISPQVQLLSIIRHLHHEDQKSPLPKFSEFLAHFLCNDQPLTVAQVPYFLYANESHPEFPLADLRVWMERDMRPEEMTMNDYLGIITPPYYRMAPEGLTSGTGQFCTKALATFWWRISLSFGSAQYEEILKSLARLGQLAKFSDNSLHAQRWGPVVWLSYDLYGVFSPPDQHDPPYLQPEEKTFNVLSLYSRIPQEKRKNMRTAITIRANAPEVLRSVHTNPNFEFLPVDCVHGRLLWQRFQTDKYLPVDWPARWALLQKEAANNKLEKIDYQRFCHLEIDLEEVYNYATALNSHLRNVSNVEKIDLNEWFLLWLQEYAEYCLGVSDGCSLELVYLNALYCGEMSELGVVWPPIEEIPSIDTFHNFIREIVYATGESHPSLAQAIANLNLNRYDCPRLQVWLQLMIAMPPLYLMQNIYQNLGCTEQKTLADFTPTARRVSGQFCFCFIESCRGGAYLIFCSGRLQSFIQRAAKSSPT